MLFPDCQHSQYNIVLCPTGPHYAKKQCRQCLQFCGFVVKPENNQLRAERLAKVNELWNASPTPGERIFLLGLSASDGRMSPRQEGRLNGMWARHLVEAELAAAGR